MQIILLETKYAIVQINNLIDWFELTIGNFIQPHSLKSSYFNIELLLVSRNKLIFV